MTTATTPIALVQLREATLGRLVELRANPDEPLDEVVSRLAVRPPSAVKPEVTTRPTIARCQTSASSRKHVAEVLGQRVEAPSLGLLFAAVIDLVAEIDSAVLERLAADRARTRRYISRLKAEIHPGRSDLRTIVSQSGWCVSANVGEEDLRRGLVALCRAGSLKFGEDIRFPL
jgi:hypothetical protein